MRRRLLSLLMSGACLTIAEGRALAQTPSLTAPASEPSAAPGAAPAAPDAGVSEIVVTASKRAERLQDVPGSVTALGLTQLSKLGVESFSDYKALVPSLTQQDGGNPGQGTLVIRGLDTAGALTSTVAVYLDDSPFTSSGFLAVGALLTPDPDISDIDHIEVLKGPQGALYGANSLGGLIRIISKKPDLHEASGLIQAEGNTVSGGGGRLRRARCGQPAADRRQARRPRQRRLSGRSGLGGQRDHGH